MPGEIHEKSVSWFFGVDLVASISLLDLVLFLLWLNEQEAPDYSKQCTETRASCRSACGLL